MPPASLIDATHLFISRSPSRRPRATGNENATYAGDHDRPLPTLISRRAQPTCPTVTIVTRDDVHVMRGIAVRLIRIPLTEVPQILSAEKGTKPLEIVAGQIGMHNNADRRTHPIGPTVLDAFGIATGSLNDQGRFTR